MVEPMNCDPLPPRTCYLQPDTFPEWSWRSVRVMLGQSRGKKVSASACVMTKWQAGSRWILLRFIQSKSSLRFVQRWRLADVTAVRWRHVAHPVTHRHSRCSSTTCDSRLHRSFCLSLYTLYLKLIWISQTLVDVLYCFLPRMHVVLARYCYRKSSVRSSVRLYVTLRYRGHIRWTSSKVITRIIS